MCLYVHMYVYIYTHQYMCVDMCMYTQTYYTNKESFLFGALCGVVICAIAESRGSWPDLSKEFLYESLVDCKTVLYLLLPRRVRGIQRMRKVLQLSATQPSKPESARSNPELESRPRL